MNPGGGNHDSFKRPKAVKLACSFRNMSKEVLEIAFGAKVTTVAGGVITAEVPLNSELTFYTRYGDCLARISEYILLLSVLYYVAYRHRLGALRGTPVADVEH